MTADTWIIVYHSLWQKPAALVGLQNNQFVGYIPLLDPRDANGDRKVSTGEWLISKMPIFGNLSREAEISEVMMMIGMDPQVRDVQVIIDGQRRLYGAAMVAVEQSISMLYIKKIAGPAAALALSGTTLTGVPYFVAKIGLEQAFKAMIDRALGLP